MYSHERLLSQYCELHFYLTLCGVYIVGAGGGIRTAAESTQAGK